MEIKIGIPKTSVDNIIGNETLKRDAVYYLVDTAFFYTEHSKENNKSTSWRAYRLFYNGNKVLIAKHYVWYHK